MTVRTAALCECGDHAFVAITRGLTTMVSPEDASLLQRPWRFYKSSRTRYYTVRGTDPQGHGTVTLGAAVLKPPAGYLVDHISGDTLDNRRPNLRLATLAQNALNRKPRVRKHDLPKGVVRAHRSQRFDAVITYRGRVNYIGRFDTPELASAAYQAKAQELFGDFARRS